MSRPRTVQLFHPIDLEIHGACRRANPFLADPKGVFTGPRGERLTIPGFYDGESRWIVRFSPVSIGPWHYAIETTDLDSGDTQGALECLPNENPDVHGSLRVDADHPHHFIFEDGTRYFMLGYEANWFWALGLVDDGRDRMREFVELIKRYRFNQVLMNVYAHDTPWAKGRTCAKDYGPPSCYPWEGTNEQPDHSRLNPVFFQNLDRAVQCLHESGLIAHVYFKVYNKFVNWPGDRSPEEDLFFKYVTARYQAFPNIIWDFSKESYYVADKTYLADRLRLIKTTDAYSRMVTVHDDPLFYAGEHGRLADFCTAQQVYDFYMFILHERTKGSWPVVNAEFAYEGDPREERDPCSTRAQTPEEVLHRACETVMAGGYPAYYYRNTAWDIIDYDHIPKGYEYLKRMYEFFTSHRWWEFAPHPELCCWHGKFRRMLARPGREYLLYCEEKANVLLHLGLGKDRLEIAWFNTRTGETCRGDAARPESDHISSELVFLKCPFDAPGIAHLAVRP